MLNFSNPRNKYLIRGLYVSDHIYVLCKAWNKNVYFLAVLIDMSGSKINLYLG